MKLLQQFTFLLIAFLSGNPRLSATGDSLAILKAADSLFIDESFYKAGIYYQKAAYFHLSNKGKTNCLLKSAQCFKRLNNYAEAIEILSPIDATGLSDREIFDVKYQCSLLSYLNSDFNSAESFIIQLNYLIHDSDLIYSANFLHALILNESFKWDEAKSKLVALNNYVNKNEQLALQKTKGVLDSLYDKNHRPKIKSVHKAVKLSTFLPGSGQIYAGYWGEGLISFSSLVFISGGMVIGVLAQYYFTSVFLGNMLIGKFYQGGIKRTGYLVEKRNYLKTKDYNFKLKSKLNTLISSKRL